MKILKYKVYKKNTLLGFLEVETPSGMILKNLTYHRKDDKEWIGLPSREYVKEDGTKAYANIVDFTTRNLYWDFTQTVIRALKEDLGQEAT